MYRVATIVTAALLLFTGCQDSSSSRPEDLIEEPLYLDVLADLFFHERMINMRNAGHLSDSLKSRLFEYYEVTPGQFERSHDFYQRQTSRQLERIDRIEKIMQSERDTLEQLQREIREAERERAEQEEPGHQVISGDEAGSE